MICAVDTTKKISRLYVCEKRVWEAEAYMVNREEATGKLCLFLLMVYGWLACCRRPCNKLGTGKLWRPLSPFFLFLKSSLLTRSGGISFAAQSSQMGRVTRGWYIPRLKAFFVFVFAILS